MDRHREVVRPETLPHPAVLARQIADDLAKAQKQFAAVAKALESRPVAESASGQLDLFTNAA
jgi:hypothetical protein